MHPAKWKSRRSRHCCRVQEINYGISHHKPEGCSPLKDEEGELIPHLYERCRQYTSSGRRGGCKRKRAAAALTLGQFISRRSFLWTRQKQFCFMIMQPLSPCVAVATFLSIFIKADKLLIYDTRAPSSGLLYNAITNKYHPQASQWYIVIPCGQKSDTKQQNAHWPCIDPFWENWICCLFSIRHSKCPRSCSDEWYP